MALSKEIVVDKIEVLEKGQLQVRTATRVMEDGVELSSSFHRHVLNPSEKSAGTAEQKDEDGNVVVDEIEGTRSDTDLTKEDAKVKAIATATWTSEVKKAYQDMIDGQNL